MNFLLIFILLICTSTATVVDKREAGNTSFYVNVCEAALFLVGKR